MKESAEGWNEEQGTWEPHTATATGWRVQSGNTQALEKTRVVCHEIGKLLENNLVPIQNYSGNKK